MTTTIDFDEELIGPGVRSFVQAVLDRFPDWRDLLRVTRHAPGDPWELWAEVPSPTGDSSRLLTLWSDRGEPSVGFGRWHTHASVWAHEVADVDQAAALVDLVAAIVSDKFVLATGQPEGGPAFDTGVDLRDPDAVLENLTDPYSPTPLRLRSWTGAADGEVAI